MIFTNYQLNLSILILRNKKINEFNFSSAIPICKSFQVKKVKNIFFFKLKIILIHRWNDPKNVLPTKSIKVKISSDMTNFYEYLVQWLFEPHQYPPNQTRSPWMPCFEWNQFIKLFNKFSSGHSRNIRFLDTPNVTSTSFSLWVWKTDQRAALQIK